MDRLSGSRTRQHSGANHLGRARCPCDRLTQSLFHTSKLRLVCYVDDPLAAILGTEEERRTMMTLMVLIWAAFGFKLSFPKGQHGTKITWIGGTLSIEELGVRAFVKQSIVEDIQDMIREFSKVNLVTKKELHLYWPS